MTNKQIAEAIFNLFGNASLTWSGLLQATHQIDPSIKTVTGIRRTGEPVMVSALLYNKTRISVLITRLIGDQIDISKGWEVNLPQ